jgi:hypothetical protein
MEDIAICCEVMVMVMVLEFPESDLCWDTGYSDIFVVFLGLCRLMLQILTTTTPYLHIFLGSSRITVLSLSYSIRLTCDKIERNGEKPTTVAKLWLCILFNFFDTNTKVQCYIFVSYCHIYIDTVSLMSCSAAVYC